MFYTGSESMGFLGLAFVFCLFAFLMISLS